MEHKLKNIYYKNIINSNGVFTLEKALKNLQTIQSQIADLKQKEINAQKEIANDLSSILFKNNFASIDTKTLIGGLLHVQDVIHSNPKQAEEWSKSGDMFLKKFNKKKRSENSSRSPKKAT